jgi:O-antigen/teichoic acid export membrane protein
LSFFIRPSSFVFRLPSSVLRPPSFLRFGFTFSLANIALVVLFRFSLIVTEKLTHSRPEVAFYDLALGGLLLIYTLLGQIAYAFIPLLTQLRLNQRLEEADVWLGRFVRYTTLFVALGVGGMWAVSKPVAPLVFGAGFEPTADALRAIAPGLLPLPLAWACVILSALDKSPLHKAWAALIGLAVFLVGAVALRHAGATGMSLAFVGALTGYTLGFGKSLGRAVRSGGVGWGIALGATLLFIPLFFLKFSLLIVALTAWSIVTLVYLLIILALRVVTLEEVKQVLRVFRR